MAIQKVAKLRGVPKRLIRPGLRRPIVAPLRGAAAARMEARPER